MNILVKITFLEMFLLIIVSYWILKKPLLNGCIVSVGLAVVGSYLQQELALFPIGVSIGSRILPKEYMRAAVYKPELGEGYVAVIDDHMPVPNHGSKQVLVKVEAAGLNPVDYKINTAVIPFARFFLRKIPGIDVSGTVVSVGSDNLCKGIKKYDSVFGASLGAIAEYTVISCEFLAKKPTTLSHKEAAALPVAFLTGLDAFDRAGFSPLSQALKNLSYNSLVEERMLFEYIPSQFHKNYLRHLEETIKKFDLNKDRTLVVIGGSGGCGLFGIKLGKIYGFSDIISINSAKNNAKVKQYGATSVVNYKNESKLARFIEEYKGMVDFIYDTVTDYDSEYDYYKKFEVLLKDSEESKYVAISGGKINFLWYGILRTSLRNLLDITEHGLGFDLNLADNLFPLAKYQLLLTSMRKILFETARSIFEMEDVDRTIEINKVYELHNTADIVSAYLKLKSRRTVGKIVVIP